MKKETSVEALTPAIIERFQSTSYEVSPKRRDHREAKSMYTKIMGLSKKSNL